MSFRHGKCFETIFPRRERHEEDPVGAQREKPFGERTAGKGCPAQGDEAHLERGGLEALNGPPVRIVRIETSVRRPVENMRDLPSGPSRFEQHRSCGSDVIVVVSFQGSILERVENDVRGGRTGGRTGSGPPRQGLGHRVRLSHAWLGFVASRAAENSSTPISSQRPSGRIMTMGSDSRVTASGCSLRLQTISAYS